MRAKYEGEEDEMDPQLLRGLDRILDDATEHTQKSAG